MDKEKILEKWFYENYTSLGLCHPECDCGHCVMRINIIRALLYEALQAGRDSIKKEMEEDKAKFL